MPVRTRPTPTGPACVPLVAGCCCCCWRDLPNYVPSFFVGVHLIFSAGEKRSYRQFVVAWAGGRGRVSHGCNMPDFPASLPAHRATAPLPIRRIKKQDLGVAPTYPVHRSIVSLEKLADDIFSRPSSLTCFLPPPPPPPCLLCAAAYVPVCRRVLCALCDLCFCSAALGLSVPAAVFLCPTPTPKTQVRRARCGRWWTLTTSVWWP